MNARRFRDIPVESLNREQAAAELAALAAEMADRDRDYYQESAPTISATTSIMATRPTRVPPGMSV